MVMFIHCESSAANNWKPTYQKQLQEIRQKKEKNWIHFFLRSFSSLLTDAFFKIVNIR